jgi:ribose transport system substrate-binding protein
MNDIVPSKGLARRTVLTTSAAAIALFAAGCTVKGGDSANTSSAPPAPAPASGGGFKLSAKAKQKHLTIAFLAQQMSAQSDQHSLASFQKFVKDNALPWDVRVQDAKGDAGTLSGMMSNSVTAKVDAMIVAYGTLTAAQGALQDVGRSKVPLFTLDSGYFAPAVCDITSNNFAIGGLMSEYMVGRLQSQGKTSANICVVYANFHHGTRNRGQTLDAVLKDNKQIKVLDSVIIEYTGFYEKTLNTAQNWLSRFGETIDAIWCPWDEPAEAAAQAIQAGGGSKSIFTVGADGTANAIEKMLQPNYPQVVTVAQAFELWSPLAAYFIAEIVAEGKPVREVVPSTVIGLPTPMIIQGVNMPPKGELPWKTIGSPELLLKQALSATGV